MQRFQKISRKVLDKASELNGKVVGGATLAFVSGTNAMAASVDLPATAQADIEGSVSNGGNLLIAVTVLILGYLVITRMVKRT